MIVSAWASMAVLVTMIGRAEAQQVSSAPLAQLQFDIVGVRLVVDPPALTVPKNIGTQINTSLALPPGIGSEARDALLQLTDGAVVEAELRGPSIPATRITVVPGQPIPLPPFALPGDYILDGIRLARNGQTILDATASDGRPATTIPIRVISEVFVTSVTSRPLSLDEIQSKGIVIDQNNFQAVNFQVAFNIDGSTFTINLPAALPTPELLSTSPDRTTLIKTLSLINQTLAATQTTLPPEFDRPGLNFSIAALPFFPVPEQDGGIPPFNVPPVTGLVVIPGNVAFLNQFFSVLLMVTNVAPDGSLLELRDVSGTIALPTGSDRVAGTFEQPGDDPLRLARIEGIGIQPTVPVVQPGPDGKPGTADDIAVIPPLTQGQGEFLVEGLAEGGHTFDIAINAVLDGLPSGPVRLTGQAAGAVFVRNPTFAVTLAHPRTIRSGEPYDVYATITNTSRSAANLVTVNLDPRGISGAQLVSDSSVGFDTIPAGQSVTAKFSLIAQQTGEVTASSFTGDALSGGGIRLTTGVGERGVPLAPNAIVLPKATGSLPASLVTAAQRVLGQAFSIATAPAEALPPDVLFIKRQTVIDRGIELAEAGERVQFGEPLGRVIQDLLLDWLGNRTLDPGFDQLMRTTSAGSAFIDEITTVMAVDAVGAPLEYQRQFAQATVARAPHLSAIASGPAGIAPTLAVLRTDGTSVGASGEEQGSTMIGAQALTLTREGSSARYAVLGIVDPQRHVFQMTAPVQGTYDFGVVIPGAAAGQLRQLRFAGVDLAAGGSIRVDVDLASGSLTSSIDRDGNGAFETPGQPQIVDLVETAPLIVGVRQLESALAESPGDLADPATYGLLVGVLFDKPVTPASAELKTNYAIDANAVIGARLQPSGRLVYLYVQKPIGTLTPRTLNVSGIVDARGAAGGGSMPIATIFGDGGHVFGQVRSAEGQPVPDALLRLSVVDEKGAAFTVSALRVDRNGSFDFDFVPRIGAYFTLTVQHPTTRDLASLSARIRGAGEQLLLNPTFLGRGTVRGRLFASDGATVLTGIPVGLIPGAVLGSTGFQVTTNALGEFAFTDVPVGVFTLKASDGQRGFAQAPGLLASSGQVVIKDLVLVNLPEGGGRLVGRVFLADGATPGAGFVVYAGQYNRDKATIAAVAQTTTDATGSFAFPDVLPVNDYDIVAVDPATQQIGTTKASISANLTASVSITLEATGTVEGVVFNGQGQPAAGAVIAGGVALAVADGNGFFRIEGVPAGSRTIQAGDPVTKRRGSAQVNVLPGQTVRVAITLESRATIVGRVLDANGNPVPRASVRIPQIGGYTFVIANNQGVFTFPDLPLGAYLLQAPGPSAEALISFMEANGLDPTTAFTSGDAPGGIGPAPPPDSSDANAVLAAYQQAVQMFMTVDESLLGLPMASIGGFGWNKVQLFQDSTTSTADIKFLPQGTAAGTTEDGSGRPTGALTRVTALAVSETGAPTVDELERKNSAAATGAFSFSGIPRFDLATFQATGIRGGDFTIEAAQQFSPAIVSFRGQLNTSTPNLTDIVLRFPLATETNGTVSGRVFMPDGVTPAPANTEVRVNFGDLTVRTDADGRFVSLLPIPAGRYTLTAQALSGLRGQAAAQVPAGGNVDVAITLLGLGAVQVQVKRTNGAVVPNALVRVDRGTFPADAAQGTTDANGVVRFLNLTEGAFAVMAEEQGTGLTGRASGVIVRSAEVTVPVVITASGRVTGTFVTAADAQPIPFAQVALSSGSVQAYAATDASGRFELLAIPVGSFSIEANDPTTGRVGRATGALTIEGETVDVTVVQVPRGTVAGVVVTSDGVTPVAGAAVDLVGRGPIATKLRATARNDGTFRFEGVSAGGFDLKATDPVSGFDGTAKGTVSFEGEVVDTVVKLEPFGSARVRVLTDQGQAASNVTLSLSGPDARTAAVNENGEFTFEFLHLGQYRVVARSLADPGDAGATTFTVDDPTQPVEATVSLRGTGSVTITVVAADGVTRVASAQVTLNAQGAFGEEPPGPANSTLVGFTAGDGTVTFQNVPVGDFFARAESAALAGLALGSVPAPRASATATVQLGASGAIVGRVLLPDGTTPAAQAIVTLRFQSQSQLQSGVLQVTTGLSGTFEFRGIPLGTFTLSAFEVVSRGVKNASGALATNGQTIDLSDLILDNAGPRVLSIAPADNAVNVAAETALTITFSEPIQLGSITTQSTTSNVRVLQGATTIELGLPVFSNGNRTVVVQPKQPLTSSVRYTLTITGAPDGPQDEAGLPLPDALVSTFTVRDLIPPVVTSLSPASEVQQVLPDAAIRVAFSEPVASATIALRDNQGASVPGVAALTLGNTVAVFAPQDFLAANTSYTFTVSNVVDTAGNPLAGGSVTSRFFTVDTLAPIISALQLGGVPRAGATVTVRPVIAGGDTSRVDYVIGGSLGRSVSTSPFAIDVVLPSGASSLSISATAFDVVGNRSSAFVQAIDIQPNQPPSVSLTNVSGATAVTQGQSFDFRVNATDDDQLAQVLFSAVGAATVSTTQQIASGQSTFTGTFSVPIPSNAVSGSSVTVQAAALDTAGNQSNAATLTLPVRDGIRPTVTVLTPVNNAQVLPGQAVVVTFDAGDDVAVATVALVCTPALSGCDTRPLVPAVASTRQTFSFTVPEGLQAPATINFLAVATDTSGNTTQVGRSVRLVDTLSPVLVSLESATGSTRVVAGGTAILRATVSDNVGVTAVTFQTDGGLTTSGTQTVSPAVTSGVVAFSVAIPGAVVNGSSITVHARAVDAAGNTSSESLLTLTVGDASSPVIEVVAPASGASVSPGQSVTLRVRATDDVAVSRFAFSASGVLSQAGNVIVQPPTTPAEADFVVPVPIGTAPGTLTLIGQAFDATGNASAEARRDVTVLDVIAPTVSVALAGGGTSVDPRAPVDVRVSATDDVAVTQMRLIGSGVQTVDETRVVAPPVSSRTESFVINISPLPPTGGALALAGSARDAAGNQGTATLNVTVLDVVAPTVLAVSPSDGATSVDPGAAIVVTFSEPMNAASLTSSSVRLTTSSGPVPSVVTVAQDGQSVSIAPGAPLAINTTFTVAIDATVADRAGNPLAAAFSSTFRTATPDSTAPRVASIDPADNATGVGTTTPIAVTFSETIDPATVTSASFRVSVQGVAVQGTFSFSSNNTVVRFTPAAAFPFDAIVVTELTNAIADPSRNALLDQDGNPLTAPLTFTFLTGNFAIVSPPGPSVVENTTITLEAQAGSSLAVASVVFTVNGVAQPAVTAAPFRLAFTVPSAAVSPQLTIAASARNAQSAEIATAVKVVTITSGLSVEPTLLGLPRGATRSLRYSIAQPAAEDLTIALSSTNPAAIVLGSQTLILRAGETQVDLPITACATCPSDPPSRLGAAVGNAAIVATSARGTIVAIASVSDPVAGQTLTPFSAPAGLSIALPPSAGQIVTSSGKQTTVVMTVLSAPAAADTPVSVTSSNPDVATATATPVVAGTRVTTLSITTGVDGVAVLTLRAGSEVWSVTVFVGTPPPNRTPLTLALPVGLAIPLAPSAGQVVIAPTTTSPLIVQLLTEPLSAQAPLLVSVISSNPAVATATATPIQPGQQTTTLSITTGVPGTAVLTLTAGTTVRSFTVFVGTPSPAQTPLAFARAAGVSVQSVSVGGRVSAPLGSQFTLGVVVLPAPASGAKTIAVSTTNANVVQVMNPTVTIADGSRVGLLDLITGSAGTATLTIAGDGISQTLTMDVGITAVPSQTAPVPAPPVGVSVVASNGIGRVIAPAGAPSGGVLGVQLIRTARAADMIVTITSSSPNVATVSGGASTSLVLRAGDLVVPISLATSGIAGSAVLTFEFEGERVELLVVVGNPPAGQLPPIVAPVVGVQVQ